MSEWKRYRKVGEIEAREMVKGEDLLGITVTLGDNPENGGMIARDPDNTVDQWFLSMEYFNKYYQPA